MSPNHYQSPYFYTYIMLPWRKSWHVHYIHLLCKVNVLQSDLSTVSDQDAAGLKYLGAWEVPGHQGVIHHLCSGYCVPATVWTNILCLHILCFSFWGLYWYTLPGNVLISMLLFFLVMLHAFLKLCWVITACFQVPNYLPSISASISLSPECHIWRFCIGLHSAPRFLVAFTYFRFYKMRFASRFPESPLSCLNLAFSISENLGLLLLTYVSSSETYCE